VELVLDAPVAAGQLIELRTTCIRTRSVISNDPVGSCLYR
jgi:hypothetical protein